MCLILSIAHEGSPGQAGTCKCLNAENSLIPNPLFAVTGGDEE